MHINCINTHIHDTPQTLLCCLWIVYERSNVCTRYTYLPVYGVIYHDTKGQSMNTVCEETQYPKEHSV